MKTRTRIFAFIVTASLISIAIFLFYRNSSSPERLYISEMESKFSELNLQLSMIRDRIDSVPSTMRVRSGDKISDVKTTEPRTQVVIAKAFALKEHFDSVPLSLMKSLAKPSPKSEKWKEELAQAYKTQYAVMTQHLSRIKASYLADPKKYMLQDSSMDTITYWQRKAEGGGGNDQLRANDTTGALLMRNGSDFVDLAYICTIDIDKWYQELTSSIGNDSALIPSETNVFRDMLKASGDNSKRAEAGMSSWTDSDYKEIAIAISGLVSKTKGLPSSELITGQPMVYGFDGIKNAYIVTCDIKRGSDKVSSADNTLTGAELVFAVTKQSDKSWKVEIGTVTGKPKGTKSTKDLTVIIKHYKETGDSICLQWSCDAVGDSPAAKPH